VEKYHLADAVYTSVHYVCIMKVSTVSLYGHVWSAGNSVHLLQSWLYPNQWSWKVNAVNKGHGGKAAHVNVTAADW